ncbi:MAG: YbaB/EbfC family nucleoid-associated protein [Candidatus Omnitrophica bacterium]|nr:YbaB/EbfC family nucleoid-associated protein [Candidatus Omnitrophota bacterium]
MFGDMKKLMEMKKQADILKKELDKSSVEVREGGVKIVLNGSQSFQTIEIEPQLMGLENKVRLEREMVKALNAAIKKSQTIAAEKMRSLMPGLPGF